MSAVGLLPAWSKIYCFTVIVADLRTWLLDVIARVWLESNTVWGGRDLGEVHPHTHTGRETYDQLSESFSLSNSQYYVCEQS